MKRHATPIVLLAVILLVATVLVARGEAELEASPATAAPEGQRREMSAAALPAVTTALLAGELIVPLDPDGGWSYKLHLARLDGSGLTSLVVLDSLAEDPRWSPDGSRLSVEIIEPGGSEAAINVMNADGTGLHQLTQLRGWHIWLPDGSHLIVQRALMSGDGSQSGHSNLYVIDANDQEQRLLLENAAIGTFPAWRPK